MYNVFDRNSVRSGKSPLLSTGHRITSRSKFELTQQEPNKISLNDNSEIKKFVPITKRESTKKFSNTSRRSSQTNKDLDVKIKQDTPKIRKSK